MTAFSNLWFLYRNIGSTISDQVTELGVSYLDTYPEDKVKARREAKSNYKINKEFEFGSDRASYENGKLLLEYMINESAEVEDVIELYEKYPRIREITSDIAERKGFTIKQYESSLFTESTGEGYSHGSLYLSISFTI